MKKALIRLFRRTKWTSVLMYAVFNYRAKRRSRRGAELETHGQSRDTSVADSVGYVQSAYRAIVEHGRLGPDEIAGSRILELGPGDNLGLALRFVAAGAAQVVALDRFEVRRDRWVEQEIYRSLLDRLDGAERERAQAAVRFGEKATFDDDVLRPLYGFGVEEAVGRLEPESFDFILSVAVLEHVYDPDSSFAAMDRLLKPGGTMLHQVDFRDHEMFSRGGGHPLTFLTISPRIWKAMTYDWGGPNRHLIDYYRDRVGALGYETRLLVNQVLCVEHAVAPRDALSEGVEVSHEQSRLIAAIRPRLQPQFRALPDEDLVPAGVFLVARKPAHAASGFTATASTLP